MTTGNGNGVYPLTHPKTRQKAAEFASARRTRPHSTKVTYEHLYRLFANKDLDFVTIGQKVRLTSQTIHRIYEDYFRGIVGSESGTERLSAIKRRAREKFLAQATVPDIPGLKRVEMLAKAQRLEVRPHIPVREEGCLDKVAKSKLCIHGVECKIHAIETLSKPAHNSEQRYGRVQMSRKTVESAAVHIFVFLCEDADQSAFIIPKEALLRNLLGDRDRAHLSIPARLDPAKRRSTRFEACDYRERWHLIRHR